MKKIVLLVAFVMLAMPLLALADDTGSSTFKVGGAQIILPPPSQEFSEVGYDNREFMEIFVPNSNRLISAYVLTDQLQMLSDKDGDDLLNKYAMVQAPRSAEYMDCGAGDFLEVIDGAKSMIDQGGMVSSFQESEDEMNRRLEAMDLDNMQVTLGQPVQLGCLFSKKDAYAMGMMAEVAMGDEAIKVGGCSMLIRVKERLLFVYLFAEYKDESTITWLRRTGDVWTDAILAANK